MEAGGMLETMKPNLLSRSAGTPQPTVLPSGLWIWGDNQYAAAETTIGFPEMLILFHTLAGLCVGLAWGAPQSVMAGIGGLVIGSTIGLIIGFLMTQLPRQANMATSRIGQKHRLLGMLVSMLGHLVWVGLGVAFWWFWVSVLRT